MPSLPAARISHFTARRLRIKVPEKRRNTAFFTAVAERLAAWESVESVETNPLTGSVLIHYSDPQTLFLEAVAKNDMFEVDFDAVFAAATRTGTALEIDGHPSRLDLPSGLARRARGFGCTFTLDSDAHGAAQLDNVFYAVAQARRAWIEPASVLNAQPLEDVLAFVRAKRERAEAVAR